ncbi:MAG TPA: MotA/TolQ/ExbB proton channel family protein [Methylomirabilota bacterium]|nr:MotA/TolQ/ExbB proton channel family protein [Methylomirabilota bacterium]
MEPTLSIFELIRQGGLAMYPLVVCSVLSLAVIGERAWILWKVMRPGRALTASVLARVSRGELEEARMILKTAETPVAEIFRGAVLGGANGDYGLAEMDRKRQELLQGLRRHLWILGTVGSLAPFIGLFGTVLGIVRSFHNMAITGQGGFAVVAAGISEALVATAAGLVVAIVALAAYNWLVTLIGGFGAFLRFRIEELVQHQRDKGSLYGDVSAVR